jgi:hypothetical protein
MKEPTADVVARWSTSWKVGTHAVSDAVAAATKAGFDGRNAIIVFLFAKQVQKYGVEMPDGSFVSSFALLVSSGEPPWRARRDRIERLLRHDGDITSDTAFDGLQTFEMAMTVLPVWADTKKAFIFHRDVRASFDLTRCTSVDDTGVSLAQRHQKSGLCYIHAPEIVQHYLVQLYWLRHPATTGPDGDVGMIDMAKMIRQSFSAADLKKHIFEDAGGSSHTMLKNILVQGSVIFSEGLTMAGDRLKQYGPGLVAEFEVFSDFYNEPELYSYDGKPTGQSIGHHAMVLIGARTDNNDKRWFLLQNWWKKKQFVEVSEEYLEACGATVYFVKTTQPKIPDEFPTQTHPFAENENIDKPERARSEDPMGPPPC